MSGKKLKVILFAALAIYVVLVYYLGSWLGLRGPNLWIFRISLMSFGIIGYAGYFLIRYLRKRKSKGGARVDQKSLDQIDLLVQQARKKLDSAGLEGSSKIGNLASIFVIGGPASAKTTSVINSGMEPELLTGQVYYEDAIVSTRIANLWYSRGVTVVDSGGSLLEQPDLLHRLLAKVRPAGRFGGKNLAPRAAVVCVDCGIFVESGASEKAAALARAIRDALALASKTWGIELPAYVLFTKADRIPFFTEYVATLTGPEVGTVLGATLPMRAATGIYAEEETKRVNDELQTLFYSLANKRLEYLPREQSDERCSSAYQFPREFNKLKNLMVSFLVDVGRPSQLQTNPFLRGFYFTGVRPVKISNVQQEELVRRPEKAPLLTDATGIFSASKKASPEVSSETGRERKVPQWVFLNHIFPDVILSDTAALAASKTSVKAEFWKRLLFSSALALALILTVGWTVSFFGNRALRNEAMSAVEAMPTSELPEFQLATVEQLEGLERIRIVAAKLADYRENGPPMRLRWGLYSGNKIYPPLARIYFGHFRRLLLLQTQQSLVNLMNRPSGVQAMGYRPVYDALKAYLITTSHPDKSTVEFLPPVLMEHWTKGRAIDEERQRLAGLQFNFYADVLRFGSPYPSYSIPDEKSVATARAYLAQFAAVEALYQAMLDSANAKFATIRFNEMYPGSADVVRNDYPVAGAFTKDGWTFMQDAIGHPEQFFQGERWVLGDQAFANIDMTKLPEQLQQLYRTDFLKIWREFLQQTRVVGYSGIPDAAQKLEKTSSIQSPLLSLFCVVSRHTSVESEEIAQVFQPAQFVTPEGCQEKLVGESNTSYMNGLIQLQASLQQVANDAANEMLRSSAVQAATSASVATRQVGQNFRIDSEGNTHATVQKLLTDPITYAQNALLGAPVDAINAAGRGFCAEVRPLLAKYPFQQKAPAKASLNEVNAIFLPGSGSLWRLYEEHVSKLLREQGTDFVPAAAGPITVTSGYQNYFRRMAAVSRALYSGGSQQPNLTFALSPMPSEGVEGITLSINGATVSSGGAAGQPWRFAWPGAGPYEARLSVKLTGGSELAYFNFTGLWAIFEMLAASDRWTTSGNQYQVEWRLRTSVGDVLSPATGRPVTVRLRLDMLGAPPILQPGYLAALGCESRIAQRR